MTREARRTGALGRARLALAGIVVAGVVGCAPDYSPNTYAAAAAQQANKVERGTIVGVRPVRISASGTVGAAAGAATGGVAGSQTPGGAVGSAFGAVGGALVGGLIGTGVEHTVDDAKAFEYIVRKPNGELLSVTQTDPAPLPVGQKVLVIAGNQARIVADYTVDPPTETSGPAPAGPPGPDTQPPAIPAPVAAAPLGPPAPVAGNPVASAAQPLPLAPAATGAPVSGVAGGTAPR